jgi:hypothetical protein
MRSTGDGRRNGRGGTIIFAPLLFFAGVNGKCYRNVTDAALLVLGAFTLIGGMTA